MWKRDQEDDLLKEEDEDSFPRHSTAVVPNNKDWDEMEMEMDMD
jgi:hypothetical protein